MTNEIFTPTVTIQPWRAYGLRTDVVGNIHYNLNEEIIYPVAGVLAIYNPLLKKQRFIRFDENSTLHSIAISPNRRLMAIAEKSNKVSTIGIYDMISMKRRKILNMPEENALNEPQLMAFTFDSKGLAMLTKGPNTFLVLYFFDKSDTIVVSEVASDDQATAICLSCGLADTSIVAIGGLNSIKLMTRQEKMFGVLGNLKADGKAVTTMAFITPDVMVVGTKQTQIVLVEGGDIRNVYHAEDLAVIDLTKTKDAETGKVIDYSVLTVPVTCVTLFGRGFAYAVHNVLMVFEKESNYRFHKHSAIKIPMLRYDEHYYEIQNVAINTAMDECIVSTKHAQIYISKLFEDDSPGIKNIEFAMFGEPLHNEEIIGLSTCSWRPIFMTAAKDNFIKIWNFESGVVELDKKMLTAISSIGLHPTGLFAAIGLPSELNLVEILLDNLNIIKSFQYPNCHQSLFSHQGHQLAIAYRNYVTILSTFSFANMATLKGHSGKIGAISWSSDDKLLISAGSEGSIYTWCTSTWNRLEEYVHKGIAYKCMELTQNCQTIYTTTANGFMREITNGEIRPELVPPEAPDLTEVAISRSDIMMFMGSASGHLYNVQLPFLDTGGGTCTNNRFFSKSVTKIKFSFDDTILAAGSLDGTLVLWLIKAPTNCISSMDIDLMKNVDVIISRNQLIEKNEKISILTKMCGQQETDFRNQLAEGDAFHVKQMKNIHEGYFVQIREIKEKFDHIANRHREKMNMHTAEIDKLKEGHRGEKERMERELHVKVITEYEKSRAIEDNMLVLRNEYELKIGHMVQSFEKQLEDKRIQFSNTKEELSKKLVELDKYIIMTRKDLDVHNEMVTIENEKAQAKAKLEFEAQLDDERKKLQKQRAEGAVLEKKLIIASKDIEEYCEEINILKDEQIKTTKTIKQLNMTISGLRKSLEEHSETIQEKERKIEEMQRLNNELEVFRNVLNVRLEELRSQVEPRERVIKSMRDQIDDIEKSLENLQLANREIVAALTETKEREVAAKIELKNETKKRAFLETLSSKIKADIFNVSRNLQLPIKLRRGMVILNTNYSTDSTFEQSVAFDEEVRNEYTRHCDLLSQRTIACKKKASIPKMADRMSGKLVEENSHLLDEIAKMRKQRELNENKIKLLEKNLTGSG